ncbi:hypothetical protein ACWDWV_00270 [Streptosporangium sandarakinum]
MAIDHDKTTIRQALAAQPPTYVFRRGFIRAYGVQLGFDEVAWNPRKPDQPFVGPGYALYQQGPDELDNLTAVWLPAVFRERHHQLRFMQALREVGLTPILQGIGPHRLDAQGLWGPHQVAVLLDDWLCDLLSATGRSYAIPSLGSSPGPEAAGG